jgi:hypothetical protein
MAFEEASILPAGSIGFECHASALRESLKSPASGGGGCKPHGRRGAQSIPLAPPFFASCGSYEWQAIGSEQETKNASDTKMLPTQKEKALIPYGIKAFIGSGSRIRT